MIYMGSKARIAKDILPIMLQDIGDKPFIDCFCGGGNLIQFVDCKNKYASDINPYTIAFLKKLQADGTDWLPKDNSEFNEENYKYVRTHKEEFSDAFLGHVGYNLSFGGKWFGGYRKDNKNKDYVKAGYEHSLRQAEKIKDVTFNCCSYSDIYIKYKEAVIYCDIPYRNTTKYNALSRDFNYEKFYNWCRKMKADGHKVYVSEYSMPEDFTCIWEKDIKMTLDVKSNSTIAREKLFTI